MSQLGFESFLTNLTSFNTPYSLYRLSGVFNKNNSLKFFILPVFSFVNQPFLKQMSKSSFLGK
ncbi:MAG: hypothetical protein LLF81_05460, partial [Porphyromonadaceae bacterium]|nr:hypothetical protein [Porphyromonadaceae bacterium]